MKTQQAGNLDAIQGFNREWAAVTSVKDRQQNIIGYKMITACNLAGRLFPDHHWDDPYGAAMRALENHHCAQKTT